MQTLSLSMWLTDCSAALARFPLSARTGLTHPVCRFWRRSGSISTVAFSSVEREDGVTHHGSSTNPTKAYPDEPGGVRPPAGRPTLLRLCKWRGSRIEPSQRKAPGYSHLYDVHITTTCPFKRSRPGCSGHRRGATYGHSVCA